MIDFSPSEEQKILRDTIVKFARERLNENLLLRDRQQVFSRDLWRECAGIGIQGLTAPEEYGGSALDPVSCAIALEALGYGCRDGGLVFSLCAHLLACVVPISMHGSEHQKRTYLRGLCDGSLIGCHAITEPDSGSDSFSIRTSASPESGGWRLDGVKTFISNAPVADVAVVFAVTDRTKGFHGGVTGFLLDSGMRGFRAGQKFEKMGLRTSPVGELVLDGLRVPDEAVLGRVGGGAGVFQTAMDWERALLVAAHVGAMERLLETSVSYARTRSQFGQPIGRFQAVSHKVADMKMRLEAARLLTYRAAWRLTRARDAALDAAITKLFVSESLVSAALDTVQLHGGYGYITEYEVERALRDAVGATVYSGTSEMQRNIIARWLGL
jgi:alkylation response protein AidB-like acyl-CoA dehydrogenase